MKKNTKALLFISSFIITGCSSEKIETSTEYEKSGFHSSNYSATAQFKTHKVAAFVVPTDQANLSFQVSGIIEQQFIKIGDSVSPGQELFKISNPSLEPQIQQFKSQMDAIQADLEQNQAEVKRVKNLKKTNAISQNELDRLMNLNDNLVATKKSIEAQLEQAQSMFDETYLKAPFAGNIAEIYKESGEVISPGEVVLVVGGVNSLEAPLFLPAFLHRNITLGQQIEVLYDSKQMTAVVKEKSQSANPKSQLFKIMIEVPIMNQIKSGEKITALINESIGNYFRLPIESVIDDGINKPFIFVIKNNQVIQASINLIDIENDEVIVEILNDDLKEFTSFEVVTAGQISLSPQQILSQL